MSIDDKTENICRVCGYDDEVFREGGWPTAAICPCCGNESDEGQKLRGWDLLKQLANIPPEWRCPSR
ncbi:hypothetical protein ACIQUZ_09595 [Streptomyces griseus]|uniref:hypothetical protein n=1 Tax=Streptomyces griseus TaxID=1911 RepID=UPI0037F74FA6